jgi:hypothetical protein
LSQAQITLSSQADRDRAIKWIVQAKPETRVVFKEAKRSLPQNDRLWSMLTEVATQVEWHGQHLTPDDWKLIFLDALKRELRIAPNIDGNGFVNLGRSSSNLSKAEFSDLIELIHLFGANHGVEFQDSNSLPAPAADQPAARTSPSAGNNSERV